MADSERAGEVAARVGVGQVRSLAFLSILREYSPVIPDVQTSEIPVCPQSFPYPAKRGTGMATHRAGYWESLNREEAN